MNQFTASEAVDGINFVVFSLVLSSLLYYLTNLCLKKGMPVCLHEQESDIWLLVIHKEMVM